MDDDNLILERKNFREMNLPSILYKYRNWEEDNHKRVLTHNELFFAPPDSFDDEFDCKIPIRYDLLTDKEIYEKYLYFSKKENPHFNREQHRQRAREWQKKGLLRDKKRLEDLNKDFLKKINNALGVLSLTAIPDNYEMWNSRYANDGKGFCVGFKTIPLFEFSPDFGGGGEVAYSDELPIIKETDSFKKKHSLQIYSKLRKWESEKEYRLITSNVQNRQTMIPNEFFAEIIIGERMPDKMKNEIIELAKTKFPHVFISIARFNNYTVTINPYLEQV